MKVGYLKGVRQAILPPAQQADAVLSQANPVSTTLYTVLDTTRNVRIIGLNANITWAVTQPTPIEVPVTIDGQTIIYQAANPISATEYYARCNENNAEATQGLTATSYANQRTFLIEGRSIKIEARITWAITQPTPLVCRVKWAKH